MSKNCCDINVKEIENGYSVEITGDGVKEKCKTVFDSCCSEENIKKCFQNCCSTGQ